MSYRCEFCRHKSAAGQAELRHQVLREDGTILREHKVCRRCQKQLADGAPVRLLGRPERSTVSAVPVSRPDLIPVKVAPFVPAALGEEV